MKNTATLRIVADRNIPFIKDALAGIGTATYLPGDAITPEVMRDADILLTRTRAKCNSALLDASPCTFIGTATIGTDHIDLDYCRSKGIEVANAPGCNAPAVGQYVLAAIARNLKPGETFADKTLGIIGAGNVGSLVGRWARATGMKVLLNDPPKEEQGDDGNRYVSLDEIAEKCDVITIHTPLTTGGKHPTFHLVGKEFLAGLVRRPLLINSARGPVTDTVALKQAYTDGLVSALAIDCWEGEPDIDMELLAMAGIATPHIAGYSEEGKIRATSMVLDALALHLKNHYGMEITPEELKSSLPFAQSVPEFVNTDALGYDIDADTLRLKNVAPDLIPSTFESLRNNYPLRPEPRQA